MQRDPETEYEVSGVKQIHLRKKNHIFLQSNHQMFYWSPKEKIYTNKGRCHFLLLIHARRWTTPQRSENTSIQTCKIRSEVWEKAPEVTVVYSFEKSCINSLEETEASIMCKTIDINNQI